MSKILDYINRKLTSNPGVKYLMKSYQRELVSFNSTIDASQRVWRYESLIHLRKIIFMQALENVYEITALDISFNRPLVDRCLDDLGLVLPEGVKAKDVSMINSYNYMKGLPFTT